MRGAAVEIAGVSKSYRLGATGERMLREVIAGGVNSLAGRFTGRARAAAEDPREFWALKDVSFEITRGDTVGIIGGNGAGKSTLLKILSRITSPTAGRARIRGRVGSLLEVGTGFHPELTGRENVYLNGAILGMRRSEIKAKFDQIVDFSGVEQFIDTPVKRYSSGMYVRLAFAVAAHLEPEILIIDEVLAVGDAAFQQKCLGKMKDAAGEGRTVLFVSHNMGAVQTLCSRGILLKGGRVVMDTDATEAVNAYLRSMEVFGTQDLTTRTDRGGSGALRLTAVRIFNAADRLSAPATGRPLCFEFELSKSPPGVYLNFTIYNQNGIAVTNFSSGRRAPQDGACDDKPRCFRCEMDPLLLLPGRYRINVAVYDSGDMQDHVEAASVFDVDQSDLEGRQVVDDRGFGSVTLPHRWLVPA